MRLRRIAGDEYDIHDQNHGHNHELAFVKIIEKKGTLDEAELLQESYAPGLKGKLMPRHGAIKGLIGSIPTAIRGLRTGKMRSLPKLIPGIHPKLPDGAQDHVKRIFAHTEDHADRAEPLHQGRGGRRGRAGPGGRGRARGRGRAGGEGLYENEGRLLAAAAFQRGFTTELHGSMALVAERLGIELVGSTAPTARAPASSPSTTRSWPTRSTPAPSRSPSRPGCR